MIYLIIALGFVLRVINLNQSLWLDEAISVLAAKNLSPLQIINQFSPGDVHPFGYYLILWLWVHIFGASEISVRAISVIAGTLGILFIYKLGARLFSKKVGLISALFLCLNPLHVYYSQEARMYALLSLFVTVSFYFFISFNSRFSKLGYLISTLFILYLDYVGYLVIASQVIYLWFSKSNKLKQVLLTLLIPLILAIPIFIYLPIQLDKGYKTATSLPVWAKVVGGLDIKQLLLIPAKTIIGRISFANKIEYFFIILLGSMLYGVLIIKAINSRNKNLKIIISWLFIPLIFMILISFFLPVLAYHRLLFLLPAFFILVSLGAFTIGLKLRFFLIGILVGISLISLLIYYTDKNFQREDWRGAIKKIDDLKTNEVVILFEDNHLPPPYLYYESNFSSSFAGLKKIPPNSYDDLADLSSTIELKKTLFLFEYLFEINDPNKLLVNFIEKKGFHPVDIYNFSGVGFVTEYQKF